MDCLTLPSTIDEVTVYRQGALVHRTVELKRNNGAFPDQLLLDGLPACLQDDSVRVRLSAPDGSTAPVAGDLKIQLLIADNKDKVEPDKGRVDELNKLRDEQTALQEMLNTVLCSINHLVGLSVPERPSPDEATEPTPSPTAARFELTVFMQEQHETLRDRKRETETELTELAEKIAHLEYLIDQENQDPEINEQELTKGVAIRLRDTDASATKVDVSIEYMVPGAQWSPSYSLHVDGEKGEAKLDMRALVAQATGEDWEGVDLKLSTALPQQWTELPELQSLRIGRRQPTPPKKGWRAPPEGADALFGDYEGFMTTVSPVPQPARDDDMLFGEGAVESCIDEEFDDICADEMECLKEESIDMEMEGKICQPSAAAPPMPGSVSMAGGPPSMPPPPPSKKMRRSAAPKRSSIGGVAAGAVADAFGGGGMASNSLDETLALQPPAYAGDLMNYPALRLAGPAGSRRGKLEISSLPQYGSVTQTALDAMYRATSIATGLPGLPDRYREPNSHKG